MQTRPRIVRRWRGVALALAASAAIAFAAPVVARGEGARDVEGTVVSIDDGDLVVDLGAGRGAEDGDVVELWRPIRVKHPVTGKILTDRFRIGSLRLGQVRRTLSLAKPEGATARPPAPGDIVVLHRDTPAPVAASSGSAPPSSSAAPPSSSAPVDNADPEARELSAIFDSLRNADPIERIKRYEAYVRQHPNGRYAVVLYEEAHALRRLYAPGARQQEAQPEIAMAAFSQPDEVRAREPLEIAIEIRGPAVGAVLQIRGANDVAYTSLPMRAAGAGYFRVTVPASMVVSPRLDYFVEAVGESGGARPVVGTATSPLHASVDDAPPPTTPKRPQAIASAWTDLAYYDTPRKNDDRVWQTEGYFGARFGDEGVRAIRSGFGVYRGVGGTLEDLDALHKSPRSVGLTYGYLEAEWGFSRTASILGRAVVGLLDDGPSGGAQAFVRIGNDRATNLLLGGEVLGGVGLRGITELQWNSFPRFPIAIRTEVTNQPAGVAKAEPTATQSSGLGGAPVAPQNESLGKGEVGARAIVQVGYRVLPELVVAVRGSYQGRTINHAGPGTGFAVTYEW